MLSGTAINWLPSLAADHSGSIDPPLSKARADVKDKEFWK